MAICQYEFQFYDEFMNKIRDELLKLLNISMDSIIKKDINDIMFILRKATKNNYMLFVSHKSNLMCLVIIRCDAIHEKEIKKLLFNICKEMENCYDEDHREEVVDVFGNTYTHLKYLEQKYNISSLFGIDVS